MTTANPPFQPVSSRVNFPELEARILDFWQKQEIFKKSVEQRSEKDLYVFYEGPSTANGRPGIHHVLARAFKDAIPRYQTMRGKRVPRKGGWDTHGLPVELEVERSLGLKSKPDIEAYGVEAFNQQCKESVYRYVQEWQRLTERIGFWVDMDDPYVTYADSYIESGWWIMKSLWDGGLVFQDYRSTPYCPRCGTGLSSHELSLGYQDDTPDPSIYVKFRLPAQPGAPAALRLDEGVPTFVMAWTTTPWTLPGNTALAVDPAATYALVEVDGAVGRERLIVAEPLVAAAVGAPNDFKYTGKGILETVAAEIDAAPKIVGTVPGDALAGLAYEPLYDPQAWGVPALVFDAEGHVVPLAEGEAGPVRRVLAVDFVSMEEGTGVVHIAPAFGADDMETGKKKRLLFLQPVDLRGNMVAPGQPWDGLFVKEADALVMADLRERGLLWRSGTIRHTYPFCWRCDTPLLYYAKPSWYIRTTRQKAQLMANNERINWYPEHIKTGRFGDWLANNIDWAVSRERYWGTPIPVWRCEGCDAADCIGSVAELRRRAVEPERVDALPELHRPYVDNVFLRCDACGGQMRRVPEVLDAWYDSGAMPYAQWHYPFENQELFKTRFPADFICEAIDQTRGWFYTLHAEATLLNAVEAAPEGIAFRNVICLGHILDMKGEKMSKSKGNVVDPWEPLDLYGADATRWYLYTASPAGQPRRFSTEQVGESVRRFLLTLWNTYSFFVTYANLDGWTPGGALGERSELDRWVLSELNLTVERATKEFDLYNPTDAGRAVQDFVEDLSNWYVRRSRRRFWKPESGADQDKQAAYSTLYTCLVTVAKLIAPLAPFVADALWQNLVRGADPAAPESVHLADWPAVQREAIDAELSRDVRLVMRVSSLGRAARARAQLKVRQPLAELLVQTRLPGEGEALRRLAPALLDELNVKALRVIESGEGLVEYQIKPNLPKLGPKYGKAVGQIARALATADAAAVAAAVNANQPITLDGFTLAPDEVLVTAKEKAGYAVAQEAGYTVALDTAVTSALADEGLARELVHRLQTLRKDAGFEIADRIAVTFAGDAEVARVLTGYAAYVQAETLALDLREGEPQPGAHAETQTVDGREVTLGVRRL